MRVLLAILLAVGLALVLAGARDPQHFALSLLGLVLLTGTASVGLAAHMQHGPRVHR